MNELHGDATASATIELDADVGLLIHAITTHGQSCTILMAAVRALLVTFDQSAIGQQTKIEYANALVETGALTALWSQLATYLDRQEFQQAALELLAVVLDAAHEVQDPSFPIATDLLDSAAQIARHSVNTDQQHCVEKLLLVLERHARRLHEPTQLMNLVDIVTKIMIAPSSQADVLTSCLRCISEVVLVSERIPSFQLGAAAASVVGRVLSANMNQADYSGRDHVPLAIAALPTVLNLLAKDRRDHLSLPVPVVLCILFATSRDRGLNEKEARVIERFIGECFHDVVKQFHVLSHVSGVNEDALGDHPSSLLLQHLPFALLWSSHASMFLEMGGPTTLLSLLDEAVTTRNIILAVSAARCLHHLCVTVPKLATDTLESERAIKRLVRCVAASVEFARDELLGHLLAMIAALATIDGFTDFVVQFGGLDTIATIIRNPTQFPWSVRYAIQLLGRLHTGTLRPTSVRTLGDSSLVGLLNECRFLLGDHIDDTFHAEYIRALAFAWDHCNTPEFTKGAAKHLIRMMRLKIDNDSLLIEMCELVLRLARQSTGRRELIDSGLVQVVAKAMYLHKGQDLQQLLCAILMHTLHAVDWTRHASVLQTLVQTWKQSVRSPSDMDTCADSLELNCYVIAAITRLRTRSTRMEVTNVRTNLCQLLQSSIEDHDQLPPQAFARIVKCCVYALQCLTRYHALSPFNGVEEETGESSQSVPGEGGMGHILRLVSNSVAKLIDHRGQGDVPALTDCCQFVWQLLSDHARTAEVSNAIEWMPVALKILVDNNCDSMLMEPLLYSVNVVITKTRRSHAALHPSMNTGGIFSALVKVLKRLASQGTSANATCLFLCLQCLNIIAWNSAFRSHAVVTMCLVAVHQLLLVFRTTPGTVFDLCGSIVQAICSDAYVEAAMQQLQGATESLLGSSGPAHREIDEDQFGELVAYLAVMLTVDQQKPLFKKRQHREWIGQLALRHSRYDYDTDCNGSTVRLADTLASSYHLLPGPDQAGLIRSCLDRQANTQDSSLLWVLGTLKWTDSDLSRCVETLTEAMTRCLSLGNVTYFAHLCDSLMFLLREPASFCDSVITITFSAAISGMCESALSHLVPDDESTLWDVKVVAPVLAIQGRILEGYRPAHTLGVDLDRLSTVCIRTLGKCLILSAAPAVDASICQSLLFERLLICSSVVFQAYVGDGADQARGLLQDTTIRQLLQEDNSSFGNNYRSHIRWCTELASCFLQEHGAIFAEKVFRLIPSPAWMLAEALSFRDETDEDNSNWRSLLDCVASYADCSGWGQLSLQAHVDLVVQSIEELLHQPDRRVLSVPARVNGVVHQAVTRLSLVLSSIRLEHRSYEGEEFPESCLHVAQLAQELYQASSLFSEHQYTTISHLILRITTYAIRDAPSQRVNAIVYSMFDCLIKSPPVQTSTLAIYLELKTTAFLSESDMVSVGSCIADCVDVLRSMMLDAKVLQGDRNGKTFRACEAMFVAVTSRLRDDSSAAVVAQLVKLAETCASSDCVQECLWLSLFKLADGVDLLLDIAAQSHQSSTAEDVIMFLHRHSSEVRHKSIHADKRELQLLLDVIRSNVAADDNKDDQLPCSAAASRTARSSAVTESALCVLKLSVRVKRCALACGAVAGFDVLYDLLSSSSQVDDGNVLSALEGCCYLTSYEENLADSASISRLIQLLYLMTDVPVQSQALIRLAFVIFDQCITLARAEFTNSLTQTARFLLWKWRGLCGDDKIDAVVWKLYPLHVKFFREQGLSITDRHGNVATIELHGRRTIPEDKTAARETIIRYYSVVQLPGSAADSRISYIDVKTSVKSQAPSTEYAALHTALWYVRDLLAESTLSHHQEFVRDTLPSVVSIIIFHVSTTTVVVCAAMEIVSNISYVLHPHVLEKHIDVHALLGSCFLHAVRSLPFALYAASFCENLVADTHTDFTHNYRAMLTLVFALMEHYPEDVGITQSCIRCLAGLLAKVDVVMVVSIQPNAIQQVICVFRHHAHDITVTWEGLVCLHQLMSRADSLSELDVVDSLSVLLDSTCLHVNYSFLVRTALACIDAIEQSKQATARQALREMDTISVLVNVMSVHLNDDSIVSMSLHLLIRLLAVENQEAVVARIASIVEKSGHVTILAVGRYHVDNLKICSMALELLLSIVEVSETSADKAVDQTAPEATTCHNEALHDLLSHHILELLFAAFDTARDDHDDATSLLMLVLEMLCDILSTQRGRDAVEHVNGLLKLQGMIEVVWVQRRDVPLLESALDGLMNAACSPQFGSGWPDLPLWLTALADSIHEQRNSPSSVEKIVGMLLRLAVRPPTAKEITRHCSPTLLQMLVTVGDHVHVEATLLTLLSQLCFDLTNVPLLIIFEAVASVLERIAAHLEQADETLLYMSLHLLATMVSHPDCLHAFRERALHVMIATIMDNPRSSQRLQHVAMEIKERIPSPVSMSARNLTIGDTSSKPGSPRPLELAALNTPQFDGAENSSVHSESGFSPHRELLSHGAVFRVQRDAEQTKKPQKITVSLSGSEEYLLLRNVSSVPLTVERVFLSQIQMTRNPEAGAAKTQTISPFSSSSSRRPLRFPKKPTIPLLGRLAKSAECTFHLTLKGELMSFEATSRDERRAWEDALQWILHQHSATA